MSERAAEKYPGAPESLPDHRKMQEMYDAAVRKDLRTLRHIPDHFKTQEMCDDAVSKKQWLFEYVPNWLVTQQQIKKWHDYDDHCNNDDLIKWYEGYQITQGSKSKNKRRTLAHCLPPRSCDGLVHVRGQEGMVEVTDSFFKSYLIRK